ncbi:YopX family protein [Brevibacillus porteri]|uniref:YopX family protein n=1 Tax=Brevibacillus porteri TaxID=2126350 RepID=UPI003D1F3F8A
MRKLKVRAWDEKRREMFIPYYGYLPKGMKRKRDFFIGFNSTGLEVSEYEGKGFWRVMPIMLFTGLIDKTGVEVFAADILQVPHDDGCYHLKVTYDEEYARFWFIDEADGDHCYAPDEFDVAEILVIGNTYANPELLEFEEAV